MNHSKGFPLIAACKPIREYPHEEAKKRSLARSNPRLYGEQLESSYGWQRYSSAYCAFCMKSSFNARGVRIASTKMAAICGKCYLLAEWHISHKWKCFEELCLLFPRVPRDIWKYIETLCW